MGKKLSSIFLAGIILATGFINPVLGSSQDLLLLGVGGSTDTTPVNSAGPNFMANKASTLTTTNNCFTSRNPKWAGKDLSDITIKVVNSYLGNTGNGVITTSLGTATLGIYVESAALTGGKQLITWNSGSATSGALAASATVLYSSDKTALTGTILNGTKFYLRETWCTDAAVHVVPTYGNDNVSQMIDDAAIVQWTGSINDGSDQENATGALTGATTPGVWGDVQAIVATGKGAKSVAVFGDSAEDGHNDSITGSLGFRGMSPRAFFANGAGGTPGPVLHMSAGNATVSMFSTSDVTALLIPFYRNCVIARGHDDITAAKTRAQIATAFNLIGTACYNAGAKVFVRKFSAFTTSGNSFQTVAGQTYNANYQTGALADLVNTDMAAGTNDVGGGGTNIKNTAFYDIALDNGADLGVSAASSQDTGLTGAPDRWKWLVANPESVANYCTSDGVHPSGCYDKAAKIEIDTLGSLLQAANDIYRREDDLLVA